ncbi:MAG: RagB/SusD family nutrient uptake outer membrane protein [Tannerella sp.]|jgi:hypothetical protein|nr:RagB/SusD family nutrient uptake outer membrane protein [Tannerella sp.]
MKKMSLKKYILLTAISILSGLAACDGDFLERQPKTSITAGNFFKTPDDLKTYVNGLYDDANLMSPGVVTDVESDNTTTGSLTWEAFTMLWGTLSAANVSNDTWNAKKWGSLRAVNFMLQNLQEVNGSDTEIQHYIGIARYMRAYFYIHLVNRFSDVPWISKALETDDPDLFKPADPRAWVVDSILADLEFAVEHIGADLGNRTGINRYCALALLSRFCLYEGTFRKYHPELNLASTADRFLQRTISASEAIINSGVFEITGSDTEELRNGIYGSEAYRQLCRSRTLSLADNKEIIQWVDYSRTLDRAIESTEIYVGLSRSLMETFLMKNGEPFTEQPGYDRKTYAEVFTNRDPRLAEVFIYPGCISVLNHTYYYPAPTWGGYLQLKFREIVLEQQRSWGKYAAIPLYRYAEILLNYAEAKAELGTLTQQDLDLSVTKIRNRVAMPPLSLAAANSRIDPVLEKQYPYVTGANKGVLLELRRERRVELACEGLRGWDLNRWYAGKRMGEHQQGIYVPGFGAYDITDDGLEDIAILERPGMEDPIANLPDEVKEVVRTRLYYLYEANGNPSTCYLENGDSGHVMITADKTLGKEFKEPQYYYRPIPQTQTILNPQLKQPYGW